MREQLPSGFLAFLKNGCTIFQWHTGFLQALKCAVQYDLSSRHRNWSIILLTLCFQSCCYLFRILSTGFSNKTNSNTLSNTSKPTATKKDATCSFKQAHGCLSESVMIHTSIFNSVQLIPIITFLFYYGVKSVLGT